MHCSGLVTARGVPDFARRSVLCEVRGARLHSALGFTLTLEARHSKACILDRALYDRIMFNKAVDAGATPLLNSSVRSVHDSPSGARSEIRREGRLDLLDSRVVIGADGYRSQCRRSARLPPPRHMLTGIQVDLKGVEADPDFVDLYFGRDVAPGFFAWAIPAEESVRVGLCTWDARLAPAAYLKKLLSRPQFSKAKRVSIAAGKIPIGPGRSAVGGRILLVGDAACHAKPLSGGGVYMGLRGAELCSQVVGNHLDLVEGSSLSDYDALWKNAFGKELARAFRIRKVFLNLTDKKMDKALRIFAEPRVRTLLEWHGDIDYPATLSSAVLKLAPKLAHFSPQIVKSLL